MLTLANRHRQASRITSSICVVAKFERTRDVREIDFVQDHDALVGMVWYGW
jgi:hypothetical protein